MFIDRHPNGYSQIKPSVADNTHRLNFTEQPFIFGIRLEKNDGTPIQLDGHLFPIFTHVQREEGGKTTRTFLKTVKCKNVIPHEYHTNIRDVDNFLCPDLNQIKEMTLEGDFFTEKFSILKFSYSICNHDKINPKCNDAKDVEDYFTKETIWASAIMTEVKYHINNKNSPLEVEIIEKYDIISPYKISFDDFYMNEYRSESDYAILNSEISINHELGVSKHKSYTKVIKNPPNPETNGKSNDPEDTALFSANILFGSDLFFYSRNYAKIQDFLGRMLGIMKIVGFIISFFSEDYCKLIFKQFLINKLLFFDKEIENLEMKKISKEEMNETIKKYFAGDNELQNKNISDRSSVSLIPNILKDQNNKNNTNNLIKEDEKEIPNFSKENEMNVLKENENSKIGESKILKNEFLDELNQNDERKEIKKDDFTPYLKETIQKYKESKNKFAYTFIEALNFIILGKEKVNDTQKVINFYARKIIKKFDIFYYLKNLRTSKIITKSLFCSEIVELLDLVSSKEYRINMKNEIKDGNLNEENERNSRILNYFMNSYKPTKESTEHRIMNYLIENN